MLLIEKLQPIFQDSGSYRWKKTAFPAPPIFSLFIIATSVFYGCVSYKHTKIMIHASASLVRPSYPFRQLPSEARSADPRHACQLLWPALLKKLQDPGTRTLVYS